MSASRSAAIANIDAGVVGGAVGDTIGVGDTATFGGDAVGDTALDIGKGDTRGINISLFCCVGLFLYMKTREYLLDNGK